MFKLLAQKYEKVSIFNQNEIEMEINTKQQQAQQLLPSIKHLSMVENLNQDYKTEITSKKQQQCQNQNIIKASDISDYIFHHLVSNTKSNLDSFETQKMRSRNSSVPCDRKVSFQEPQQSKSLKNTQLLSTTINYNTLKQREHIPNNLQHNIEDNRIFIPQQNLKFNSICTYQLPKKQQKKFIKRRFKIIFLILIIIIRLRSMTKKRFIQLKAVFKNSNKEIAKYHSKGILSQRQNFVKFLANKITWFMQASNYQEKCEIEQQSIKADFRKTNLINLSKLFYQNLELITRVNNFPQLFQSEMIMNLFYNKNKNASVFIGQRCYFYKTNKRLIPKEQKLAISLEYLFFVLIIPNLLRIPQNLAQTSTKVKEDNALNLLGIASYMHKQFLYKFQKLKKLESPNANMIFKRFNLIIQGDDKVQFEIIENKNIGDENLVIDGLIDINTFLQLEAEKPFWKYQMEQLFEKICLNVEKMIDF